MSLEAFYHQQSLRKFIPPGPNQVPKHPTGMAERYKADGIKLLDYFDLDFSWHLILEGRIMCGDTIYHRDGFD